MTKANEFKVGDKAVYPAHGVGEITDIMTRKLGGQERQFYTLKVLENGMKIMVPVSTATAAGLRPIVSSKEAREVFKVLQSDDVAVKTQPWNRRYREYMDMLKSGSPFEVAKVLRDLYRLKFEKELSFGERRLLDTANTLLIVELSLALEKEEAQVKKEVEEIFAA
jgi:CarD family transcriptional regulator